MSRSTMTHIHGLPSLSGVPSRRDRGRLFLCPDGTFSGTPSSPGRFRVVVDVVVADQPLHAVFERTAFG